MESTQTAQPTEYRSKAWIVWLTIAIIVVAIVLVIVFTRPKQPEAFTVGAALPLTGEGAVYGKAARNGIELALSEIDQSDSPIANKIRVVYEDTRLEPRDAISAVRKLVDIDRVPVIIGPMASSCAEAAAPIAEEKQVVLLSPSATSHKLTEAGDYFFRTVVSDIYDGTAMAQFAYNDEGHRTVCLLYIESAGPYGVTQSFEKEFTRLGGSVLSTEKGPPGGTDFRTQLERVRVKKPDALFFAGFAKETAVILKQAKELGVELPLLTHQVAEDADVRRLAGDAADSVIFTTPKLDPSVGGPVVKRFYEEYERRFNEEPGNFASNAYDAMHLVAKAIEERGSSSESIKRYLYSVEGYEGASGDMTFDENGDVVQSMRIMTIRDGKVIPYKP